MKNNYLIYCKDACYYWLTCFLLLSLSLFICTYPPLTLGLWPQSEIVLVGLWATSIAIGLSIFALSFLQPQRFKSLFYHPVALLLAAIGLMSLVFSSINRFPMRSWFGAPELGEGALWYLAFSLIVLGALALKHKPKLMRLIAGYAVCAALFVTLLTLMGEKMGLWRPYYFTDYLAFYGLVLFPILIGAVRNQSKIWWTVSFIVTCIPILVSGNHSAEPFIVLMPIVVGCACFLSRYQPLKYLAAGGLIVAPIMVLGMIFLMGYYIAPESKFGMLTQSIWSRYQLMQTAFQQLQQDHLIEILFGHGWGSFTDIAARYIPIQETKLFMFSSSGTEKIYWDSLSRADFHSHAQLVEAFVSIGLFGTLLILFMPATIFWYAHPRYQPVVLAMMLGFVVVSAMWFQFAITLPYVALGIACMLRVGNTHAALRYIKRLRVSEWFARCLIVVSISFLSYGMTEGFLLAKRSNRFAAPEKTKMHVSKQCGDELGDIKIGGQRLAIVNHEVNYFLVHTEQEPYPQDWYDRFDWLRCAVDRYLAYGAGERFKIIDLLGRAEWAFAKRAQKQIPQVQKMLDEWEFWLDVFLQESPARTDLAAPYLVWRIERQEEDQAYAFARKLYIRNSEDPVALWFVGLYELQDSSKVRFGLEKMQIALQNGIQNIMPIDRTMIEEIMNWKA